MRHEGTPLDEIREALDIIGRALEIIEAKVPVLGVLLEEEDELEQEMYERAGARQRVARLPESSPGTHRKGAERWLAARSEFRRATLAVAPARRGGNCRKPCTPTYQANVWSAREKRRIFKTFPTYAAAKTWRSDALVALRKRNDAGTDCNHPPGGCRGVANWGSGGEHPHALR
jgi:hypothetical protein